MKKYLILLGLGLVITSHNSFTQSNNRDECAAFLFYNDVSSLKKRIKNKHSNINATYTYEIEHHTPYAETAIKRWLSYLIPAHNEVNERITNINLQSNNLPHFINVDELNSFNHLKELLQRNTDSIDDFQKKIENLTDNAELSEEAQKLEKRLQRNNKLINQNLRTIKNNFWAQIINHSNKQ